jgi:hypothetical protein
LRLLACIRPINQSNRNHLVEWLTHHAGANVAHQRQIELLIFFYKLETGNLGDCCPGSGVIDPVLHTVDLVAIVLPINFSGEKIAGQVFKLKLTQSDGVPRLAVNNLNEKRCRLSPTLTGRNQHQGSQTNDPGCRDSSIIELPGALPR